MEYIPVHKDYRLNERMYGALAGLDKKETVEKHGAEQVGVRLLVGWRSCPYEAVLLLRCRLVKRAS